MTQAPIPGMCQSLAVEREFTFPTGDLGRESIELKRLLAHISWTRCREKSRSYQTIIAIVVVVVTVAIVASPPTSQTRRIEPDEYPVGICKDLA